MRPKNSLRISAGFKEIMVSSLESCEISHGLFPSNQSFRDLNKEEALASLPKSITANLDKYVGGGGAAHIAKCETAKFLKIHSNYQSEDRLEQLKSILSEEQIQLLFLKIVAEIESLPRKYKIIIRLPELFYEARPNDDSIRLGSNAMIAFSATNLPSKGEQTFSTSLGANLFPSRLRVWDENTAYYCYESEGYCEYYSSDAMLKDFWNDFRGFLGVFSALNKAIYPSGTNSTGRSFNLACINVSEAASYESYGYDTSPEESKFLREISQDIWGYMFKKQNGVVANLRRGRLLEISHYLSHEEKNPSILIAAQWFFDSINSANEMTSFVQAAIAMEALYGDDKLDELSVTSLIANRYGYSVGKNHAERMAKVSEFKKIYNIRSRIMHRGKNSLSANEQAMAHKLKVICCEAIEAEIGSLAPSMTRKSKQ